MNDARLRKSATVDAIVNLIDAAASLLSACSPSGGAAVAAAGFGDDSEITNDR